MYHTSEGAKGTRIALAFGPLSRITTVCSSAHYGQLVIARVPLWHGLASTTVPVPPSSSVVQLFRARRVVVRRRVFCHPLYPRQNLSPHLLEASWGRLLLGLDPRSRSEFRDRSRFSYLLNLSLLSCYVAPSG